MSANSEAERVLKEFGVKLSKDLEQSLIQALSTQGRHQAPKLNFGESIEVNGAGVTLNITASGEYWRWIESGRKKGARRVPADKLGKDWQVGAGILDARKVLLQMRVKSSKKKLTHSKTTLSYDKAARSLSFVIQNSIYKKGIRPKPFIDRVIDDGRIETLSQTLRQVLGPAYKLEIISEFET